MAAPKRIDAHLPAGREPGPQSRRAAGPSGVNRLLMPAMAALFVACFIGIPLAIATLTPAPIVNYTAIGVLTVVFLVGLYVLARRFRSPAARHFEVIADPLELERGEDVEAELHIHDAGKLAGRLEVGLVCVERYERPLESDGDGDGDGAAAHRETAEHVAYERWLPAWRTAEPQSFAFRVPESAPYSHEGECISFAWRVSAREPERPGEDGISDDPIWVLP